MKTRSRGRRPIGPKEAARACRGTFGNKKKLARALGTSLARIEQLLTDPAAKWDSFRLAFQKSCEEVLDEAEERIVKNIRNDDDPAEAGRSARWVLERRRGHLYSEKKTVTVEGGQNPLKVKQQSVVADARLLRDLPVEVRRQLLEAVEKAALQPKASASGGDEGQGSGGGAGGVGKRGERAGGKK